MRILILSALATMTAACGTAAPAPNQSEAAANIATPQASGARIAALTEGQRNAVFIRALLDAGLDCQEVTGSVPTAPYRGFPAWNATCRGGGQWTLVIGENQIVQILNPEEARLAREGADNRQ
jgi:hypothetical protein